MSAFLFVVPPLVGHVNPLVGVASELAARGHRVAWAGDPELVRRLAGPGAAVHPCSPSHPGGPDGGVARGAGVDGR
ncbi:glycosyltransferase, partial [Streptomyces sp. WAC05292]